jgi:hypothetical protein
MVEVHNKPDEAMSDGPQSLFPDQFDELMTQVRQIAAVVGRTVPEIDWGSGDFKPGTKDGTPVSSEISVDVSFHL